MDVGNLVVAGLLLTALDIDLVIYVSAMSQTVEKVNQNRLINRVLLIETLGRIIFLALVLYVLDDDSTLFTLFGVDFTAISLALLLSGIYLFITSSIELGKFVGGAEEGNIPVKRLPFSRAWIEISTVNLVLSLDGVIVAAGASELLLGSAIIMAISVLIRWPFIRQIATYMEQNPSLTIITTNFLILIGITLILEGIQVEFPNEAFGLGLIAAFIVQVVYKKYHSKAA